MLSNEAIKKKLDTGQEVLKEGDFYHPHLQEALKYDIDTLYSYQLAFNLPNKKLGSSTLLAHQFLVYWTPPKKD